jgi:hypothetical protein
MVLSLKEHMWCQNIARGLKRGHVLPMPSQIPLELNATSKGKHNRLCIAILTKLDGSLKRRALVALVDFKCQ